MNKINNILLSTNKADIYNLHIRIFFKQCVISYKVHIVTDCLEKDRSRSETLIYAFPLYINGNTQMKIIILKQRNIFIYRTIIIIV